MLRLFPEKLHIGIGRTYATLALKRGKHLLAVEFCQFEQGQWFDAHLAFLQRSLRKINRSGLQTDVYLASDVAHLTLLPWRDALTDHKQQQLLAQAHFRQILGNAAETLEIRVETSAYGQSWLASAVDQPFLNALQSLCAEQQLQLSNIAPLSPALFNAFTGQLAADASWLVVPEDQSLSLMYVQDKRLCLLRQLPLKQQLAQSLEQALLRESRLAGLPDVKAKVFMVGGSSFKPRHSSAEDFSMLDMNWDVSALSMNTDQLCLLGPH